MKLVSKKHREGGAMCDFCRPEKVPAKWKIGNLQSGLACAAHKHKLREMEETHDDHLTEADYQTWMKL